jgi:hypothetical protein
MMVEEAVWVKRGCARPRLSLEELWLMYRLIDNRYWLLKRSPNELWDLGEVDMLRRKILKLVNKRRRAEHRISLKQRVY